MIIDLNEEDSQLLILALGLAAGQASGNNPKLFRALVRLANTVNANNPAWTPYDVSETEASHG